MGSNQDEFGHSCTVSEKSVEEIEQQPGVMNEVRLYRNTFGMGFDINIFIKAAAEDKYRVQEDDAQSQGNHNKDRPTLIALAGNEKPTAQGACGGAVRPPVQHHRLHLRQL